MYFYASTFIETLTLPKMSSIQTKEIRVRVGCGLQDSDEDDTR